MITWGSGKKPNVIYTSTNFWIGKRWSRFVSFARKRQIGNVSIALLAWHIVQNVAAPHTAKTPFHRIERWTGIFYEQSWLWKVGLVIHLGHNGDRCPQAAKNFDDNLDLDEEGWFDCEGIPSTSADPKPWDRVHNGGQVMTIMHTSGVHYLPVVFCGCSQAAAKDIQLFWVGLYSHPPLNDTPPPFDTLLYTL